jgi:RNA polymerase sigma factor (sigma-70 family)
VQAAVVPIEELEEARRLAQRLRDQSRIRLRSLVRDFDHHIVLSAYACSVHESCTGIMEARERRERHKGEPSVPYRVSRGVDARAFERLFEQHFDSVYGYLARRIGPELARDLASETFARAFAARRGYDAGRGEPRPWLFGIAHNVLRRHYRDEERRLRALAQLEPRESGAAFPEESRLAAALAALAVEERDTLLLFVWADLSYEQIAETLALPIGTVRSRLHRARGRLREALIQEEALDG